MKTLRSLAMDIRAVYPALGWILFISAIFLGAVLGLHWWKGIPIGNLTRDPATITSRPFHAGFLSNIGILFWSATTTLCLFSGWLVTKSRTISRQGQFLVVSGLLTLLLTLDDLFLLHEDVLPNLLGLPEHLVYGAYLSLSVIYLIGFHRVILETEYPLLGLALIFLGLSVALDVYLVPSLYSSLFEDGPKFIGIVSWMIYFTRVSSNALQH